MEEVEEQYVEPAHDDADDVVDADDFEPEQDQQLGFPGEPVVTSMLTQYEHHVARRIWEGEDRGSLKVITHGSKLNKFSKVPVSDPVLHWIREFGLLPLSSAYLTMADVGLISAFVERWHRETSSFHMPFGEMTITLDDMANLLHISPRGKFFDAPVNMNTNNAARAAYEHLGATWEEALAEINYNKCAQYRLQWLRDLYSRLIQTNQFEYAARTYMLHLVGSTIFADKTHTRVEAEYCWIYEHFPSICKRGDRGAVPAHLLRACRWTAKHVVEGGLMTYRRRLDALSLEDISMFSGYLRFGGVSVMYLPERCLRQFGRIQCISRDVPRVLNIIDWEWQSTMRSSVAAFQSLHYVANFPGKITTNYYAWYLNLSHPLIHHPPTVVAHAGPSSSVHAGKDRRADELARRALDMVAPFSEIQDILSELCRLYDN
uniref:Protein MAIN-LIKE 1-like n=1 Tax=Cicer arietinum TaxID=3827 RepID=A0A1S2Y3G3_CICAR|nr:protein MAIN-LIKE 1-like [Cicer arietinum]